MMSLLSRSPWAVIWQETAVVGVLANSVRATIQIPESNYGLSLGCLVTAFTGGSITPKFRFGFQAADAATSVRGFDLRNLAAINQSDWGSVPVGANAVAAPNVVGNSSMCHPPYVTILFDSIGATNLSYVVIMSCWFAP